MEENPPSTDDSQQQNLQLNIASTDKPITSTEINATAKQTQTICTITTSSINLTVSRCFLSFVSQQQ